MGCKQSKTIPKPDAKDTKEAVVDTKETVVDIFAEDETLIFRRNKNIKKAYYGVLKDVSDICKSVKTKHSISCTSAIRAIKMMAAVEAAGDQKRRHESDEAELKVEGRKDRRRTLL